MGRRESAKDRKRAALIEAGMQLFAEQGLATTTIDQITALADVAKGTFYNYFTTKEDLLVAGMMIAQAKAADEVRGELFALPTTRRRLERLVRWVVAWVALHPELSVIWCLERLRRGFTQEPSGYDLLLMQIVTEGQATREFRTDRRPELIATEISGIIVTYIVLWYHSGLTFDLTQVNVEALEAYMAGNQYESSAGGTV